MRTKFIIGISLAAALGASAVGANLLCKPTLINNSVYSRNISNTKNIEKETVTIYVPNQALIKEQNDKGIIKHDEKNILE